MAACSAAAQCIWCQPHRQICTKPGITEVQLWRFAETLELIVGIGSKQIDDAQSYKHVQPFLCRAWGNVGRFRQCGIIDLLRHERGASNKELAKTHSIGDSTSFGCITHQVGIDVGVEILLSEFIIHALHLRHTALPNVLEYLNYIVLRNFLLPCLQRGKRKIQIRIEYKPCFFSCG